MSLEHLNCFPKCNNWEVFKWHMHWVRAINSKTFLSASSMACTSSNRKFWSVLILWSIKGLASLPVIPDKRSIHTKPSGYKPTCMQGWDSTPHDSSAVEVLQSQEVPLLQECFLTWTSDSIVTMTTVCLPLLKLLHAYNCCYLTCIYASEMHVPTSFYIMNNVTICCSEIVYQA